MINSANFKSTSCYPDK